MTHELPPFSSWPARDQRIWLHGFNAGRESGFLAGWDKAEAYHWRLPTYEAAVKSIIGMGVTAIDRRESARRRGAA